MTCALEDVIVALALPDFDGSAAQFKMAPSSRASFPLPEQANAPRLGAVLVLLYCHDGALHLVLTKRRDDLGSHAGQVSFPGGRHEPPETYLATALRETQEEIGVAPQQLSVLGQLTPLYIPPSGFEVHPYVAYFPAGRPAFVPDRREVAQIIEVTLAQLLAPDTRVEELWELRGQAVTVPYFAVDGHKVWGATAMMLSEFVERLRVAAGRRTTV